MTSYLSLTDADAWFGSTLRGDFWISCTETKREQALLQATQDIEGLGGSPIVEGYAAKPFFQGTPYEVDQEKHFPLLEDDNALPESLIAAVCEQAYWLLDRYTNTPLVDVANARQEGLNSLSADGVSFSVTPSRRPAHICQRAWEYMRPLIKHGATTTAGAPPRRYVVPRS